jgi:hypothetical protein
MSCGSHAPWRPCTFHVLCGSHASFMFYAGAMLCRGCARGRHARRRPRFMRKPCPAGAVLCRGYVLRKPRTAEAMFLCGSCVPRKARTAEAIFYAEAMSCGSHALCGPHGGSHVLCGSYVLRKPRAFHVLCVSHARQERCSAGATQAKATFYAEATHGGCYILRGGHVLRKPRTFHVLCGSHADGGHAWRDGLPPGRVEGRGCAGRTSVCEWACIRRICACAWTRVEPVVLRVRVAGRERVRWRDGWDVLEVAGRRIRMKTE